jgi:hypothetical protein
LCRYRRSRQDRILPNSPFGDCRAPALPRIEEADTAAAAWTAMSQGEHAAALEARALAGLLALSDAT